MGVDALSTPKDVVAWSLAAMFLFAASAHFTRTREDLVAMVPRAFPNPGLLVSVTGVLEALGAVGLLIPATRGLAGLCLVLLLVALLPANVSAARRGVPMRGRAPTPLRVRIPDAAPFRRADMVGDAGLRTSDAYVPHGGGRGNRAFRQPRLRPGVARLLARFQSVTKLLKTRAGVSLRGGSGRSQGRRQLATAPLASKSCA